VLQTIISFADLRSAHIRKEEEKRVRRELSTQKRGESRERLKNRIGK
jgi:hypothetical protein